MEMEKMSSGREEGERHKQVKPNSSDTIGNLFSVSEPRDAAPELVTKGITCSLGGGAAADCDRRRPGTLKKMWEARETRESSAAANRVRFVSVFACNAVKVS